MVPPMLNLGGAAVFPSPVVVLVCYLANEKEVVPFPLDGFEFGAPTAKVGIMLLFEF